MPCRPRALVFISDGNREPLHCLQQKWEMIGRPRGSLWLLHVLRTTGKLEPKWGDPFGCCRETGVAWTGGGSEGGGKWSDSWIYCRVDINVNNR